MLRAPGFSPAVRDGIGRLTKTHKLDEFRDNWWRLVIPAGGSGFHFLHRASGKRASSLHFFRTRSGQREKRKS